MNTDAYNARDFAPEGKTPIVRLNAKQSSIHMILSITNQGKVRFLLYRETMRASALIPFMSRLIKEVEKKFFLILDNHRIRHSKRVKKWLEAHQQQTEVFFLPPYAPEYNPDEHPNGDLKQRMRSGLPFRDQEKLKKTSRSFMRTLQRRLAHVRNYFKHHLVSYAA